MVSLCSLHVTDPVVVLCTMYLNHGLTSCQLVSTQGHLELTNNMDRKQILVALFALVI